MWKHICVSVAGIALPNSQKDNQGMSPTPGTESLYELVFYDDPDTPVAFVGDLIAGVFALPRPDAESTAWRIGRAGRWSLGPYPEGVADALLDELRGRIDTAGHPLRVEKVDFAETDPDGSKDCSFCGKSSNAVNKLFAGTHANICDECVIRSSSALHELLETARFRHTHQLLDWHFGDVSPDSIVKTSRRYPGRVRADLQIAVESLFDSNAVRSVGIKQDYGHEQLELTALWTSGRNAKAIAPLSYEEIDIGEAEPKQCQINGLWILEKNDTRYAAVLSREMDYQGGFKIYLEIAGPQGDEIASISRDIFDAIESQLRQAHSYRGKVLSLEQSPHYGGASTGITVHQMDAVQRDQVILPEKTLDELDRTIIRFCEQRDSLRELGLQTKRGVMFYGAPGTGKTHTIRYLATQLDGHTTFLITAEQIALLPEYFALARLMQPVIFVIEDADLLAKSREYMGSAGQEVLLNHLLNEMDGLKEEADILFVLSSNKPEVLEEALVARPGRVDQAIEFPKPDDDCRRRLMALYGGKLSISDDLADDIVHRTKGVSASFVKELMRRLAQYSIERGATGKIAKDDVEQALEEMLFSNSALNRVVLGAETGGE